MSINRLTYVVALLFLALCGYLYVSLTSNSGPVIVRYVGSERCRTCHSAQEIGNQYGKWSDGPHARAYADLMTDSARSIMRRLGKPLRYCETCHVTAGGSGGGSVSSSEGVGCEACHGPGSLYASYSAMVDQQRFKRSGGLRGRLDDCYQCHRANPSADSLTCPEQRAPFDADSAFVPLRHPKPQSFVPHSIQID